MKNAKQIILIIACMIFSSGCRSNSVRYEFKQEIDQIVSIQIAEGISQQDTVEGNYDKIKVVATVSEERWEEFLEDFEAVRCSRYRNDPCQSVEGDIIWITYANGAIELIGDCSTFYHWIEGEKKGDFLPYYFDLEQFHSLIIKYAEE